MCAKKNALWGKFLEASGRKLSDAPPDRDFTAESDGYGYETAMGRASWPSRDPIGERGGLNLYGMVRNNAMNEWDYLGQIGGWGIGNPNPPPPGWPGYDPNYRPPQPFIEPNVFDNRHPWAGGPSTGDHLHQEVWFEKNYGPEIDAHKKESKQHIDEWVKDNCGKSPYPGDGDWDITKISPDGAGHKQGTWERTAELGHFSIQTKTPVIVTYVNQPGGGKHYKWSTTVRISDDLGFSDTDPWIFRLFQFASPPRNITRALWELRSSGYCGCP